MIWNKLLSMVVRVSQFSFFLFKYYYFCVFFVYFYYSLILLNITAELKQWTPKNPNILYLYQYDNWKKMLRLEPATFGPQAMLVHPSTKPSQCNIVIVLNIITFFMFKQTCTTSNDFHRLHNQGAQRTVSVCEL